MQARACGPTSSRALRLPQSGGRRLCRLFGEKPRATGPHEHPFAHAANRYNARPSDSRPPTSALKPAVFPPLRRAVPVVVCALSLPSVLSPRPFLLTEVPGSAPRFLCASVSPWWFFRENPPRSRTRRQILPLARVPLPRGPYRASNPSMTALFPCARPTLPPPPAHAARSAAHASARPALVIGRFSFTTPAMMRILRTFGPNARKRAIIAPPRRALSIFPSLRPFGPPLLRPHSRVPFAPPTNLILLAPFDTNAPNRVFIAPPPARSSSIPPSLPPQLVPRCSLPAPCPAFITLHSSLIILRHFPPRTPHSPAPARRAPRAARATCRTVAATRTG